MVEKASSEINPSTGEPWTPEELYYTPGDLNHYLRAGKPLTADVVVGTRWHPYAARTVDIKAPWQAVLDDRAGELAAKAAEYPLRLQRDREREAAQERQRIENEKLNHEHRIREAQATEFYEQRLRPRLVELGVDHDTPYGTGAGHVRITHEELGRLLDLLDPNLTRDT